MQKSNAPSKLTLPFANAGAKNTIPAASQIGVTPGAASLTDGFPPLTRTPLAAGGVPPSGLDMNGILYALSAIARWSTAGGGYPFDATFAADTNVGGYPKGACVQRSDGAGYWLNTADNNTTDPESAGSAAAGWIPIDTAGITSVAMTSANVTLTPLQYGKPVIVITGALTANLNLVFPPIGGDQWVVINNTTGNFAITAKTASGTGVVVTQGQITPIYSDGTNIQTLGQTGRLLNVQVFTANGTYTPTPGTTSVVVEVQGGGGAGGGAQATTSPNVSLGAGGSSGAYAKSRLTAAQIGASQAVTVGAGGVGASGAAGGTGGTSSFGALVSAAGGPGGGQALVAGYPYSMQNFSVAATPSSGNIVNAGGSPGGMSIATTSGQGCGGSGGSSVFGGGGRASTYAAGSSVAGINAAAPGAGGSGGTSGGTAGAIAGGNGAAGIVIVWEFA